MRKAGAEYALESSGRMADTEVEDTSVSKSKMEMLEL